MERYQLHSDPRLQGLPPLRLVSRRTQEHVGACPFCGGDQGSDRFHIWMEPGHERFWCRACDAKGPLKKLLGEEIRPRQTSAPRRHEHEAAQPTPDQQEHYRQIYATIALWAHTLLIDPANPEPLDYIRKRGIDEATISHTLLGATLRDPQAIPALLRRECPDLLPYAEAAGVLARDYAGDLRAHPNLCGALLFPYLTNGQVVDLRTRSFPGKGYRSLPGGYSERGATAPFGWDSLDDSETIILTEGEFKALAVTQAYRAGRLSAPALAHPGLSYIREEWAAQLLAHGVRTVILAYDSGPRPVKDGTHQLAPEEIWTIRHGQRLADAGLAVRVLRLPLAPGQEKADLDAFLLDHSPTRLQQLIDSAASLRDYHHALPRSLLGAAHLPPPQHYPTRRARPQRIAAAPAAHRPRPQPISLEDVRAQIAAQVQAHATGGKGFLVLAHQPGVGKGHNSAAGLKAYMRSADAPGQIVWTALRKEQIRDQDGLDLTPLHGRNPGNCHKFSEAQALSGRGYSVRDALCQRRCPFVDHCTYLRQFSQEADFFAPMPLLQATGWWKHAGVVVLDEFDPARLTRIVQLTSADLAAMGRSSACPHARSLLRWLAMAMAEANDSRLSGALLLARIDAMARAEGIDLDTSLLAAEAGLPADEDQQLLSGLPQGAGLAEYSALPPNYMATIIRRLARERRSTLAGAAFTSRIELSDGRLTLFLRIDHLIDQLATPEQPKLILDATVSAELLQAIFPATPLQIERPPIAGGAQVTQIISRDWAKSTLRHERRERWYAEVAAQIRPGRPTLVVSTLECEADLQASLEQTGHTQAIVAHYGALRGSNAYKGYDVVLAQVYHPNLDAIVREGRALFADDGHPLDETIITIERTIEDAGGARWTVQVPTFADPRLAALLDNRREAEMLQCALRGRPLDHPEAQITLLFGLPLPGLTPTIVREGDISPASNPGRQEATWNQIVAAVAKLLADGKRRIRIDDIVRAAEVSANTVRKYWAVIAAHFHLHDAHEIHGGAERARAYRRKVLICRGRDVPPRSEQQHTMAQTASPTQKPMVQARNTILITCLHHRFSIMRQFRRHRTYRARVCSTGPP